MKKTIITLVGLFYSVLIMAQQDPVLLEINGKKVTKSEFLQIYLKNNPDPKYDKNSLDEYMTLFKKFKLKVAAAETMGYDTVPKLKKELDGYKKQLALPYLVDVAKNEELVSEAYLRTKSEVRASHILIRLEPTASPADTLAAYNRILALRKRIEQGEDFSIVARSKSGSEDPSVATNGGDLGYFNAFQMVYPFEEAAYKTAKGEISAPFRTRFGYHILKVTDKRATRGTIKTAHIMVATPKTASDEEVLNAEKKINEIYEKLVAGEKFATLAKDFSDDPSSSQKGGELPLFGSGTTTRMVPSFEDAAFALKNNGDFSRPVKTDYGFHIIQRIEWTDVKPFEDLKKELQNKVNKDERSKKTQDSFVTKLKKEYNYIPSSHKGLKWFEKNLDTTYFIGKWQAKKLRTNKVLFELDNHKYGQKDFAAYLEKNYRNVRKDTPKAVIKTQIANWEKDAILAHEETKLEAKYPEYKALVNEYHDGILLYEVMTDKVWNKAMRDTTGLKTYFEQNRAKYVWGKRVDAVVYECLDAKIAAQVFKMIQNDTINSKHVLEVVNKDSELNLRVRTNKFDVEQTAFLKDRKVTKGVNMPYELDGKTYVLRVNEILEPSQKELSESKGAATSDYQNYLENQWMEELFRTYPVKINEDVLYSIGK